MMLRVRAVACLMLLPLVSTAAIAETTPPASAETAATTVAATEAAPVEAAAPAPADAPAATTSEPARASTPPPAAEAPVAPAPVPQTMKVSIDLGAQSMTVIENGVQTYVWAISSGTASHPTPRGTFNPQWTAKMWYSRKYDMAPMPHAVFIHGGVAIHATYHTGALGSPASHGCIRLAPANAKKFYNLVHRHGLKATTVAIYGSPKYRAPAIASRQQKRRVATVDNGSWFWGDIGMSPSYSAYDQGFIKKPKTAKIPPSKYYGKTKTAKKKPNYGGSVSN